MEPFSGVDYYRIDDLLSDEEKAIRQTVRDFVTERILPIIDEHNRNATFPAELIKDMASLGLLGAAIQGYGCAGVNSVAYGLILQELERGDSGVRSFASVTGSLVMYPIHTFGSEAQKDRWLPALAKGERIGCFGLTEPDHGSDPGGMETKAVRKGDGWVLSGCKRWITNASIAHVAVIWAKTDHGVRGFLVESDRPGYRAKPIKGKFSLRASDTGEIYLDDCHVPGDAILPGTDGLKSALKCLNNARYGISWGAIGAAMACYHEALHYAKGRVQFDRPIAGFQLVQAKLVEILSEITKAQLLCLQLGRLKDQGKMVHTQVSIAKRNNVRMALETARTCRDILGANGVADEYQCFRHMCNLESVFTYEGTHDIHTLIIGQDITGLGAFSG